MKRNILLLLAGFVLIVLLDVIGSILSRQFQFNYAILSPLSYIIYIIITFLIAKQSNRKTVIISGGLLGLFDATIGLLLSNALNANTGKVNMHQLTLTSYIFIVVMVVLTASLFGLFGYWLSTKIATN
jgi:hypothetical protein